MIYSNIVSLFIYSLSKTERTTNNDTQKTTFVLAALEYQLRILRSADSIFSPERKHQQNLRHTRSRPSQSELFLDTSSTYGNGGAASCGQIQRQDLVPPRKAHPLSFPRSSGCSNRDVHAAECRQLRPDHRGCHDFRSDFPHASGYVHQYGHAAFQDARG